MTSQSLGLIGRPITILLVEDDIVDQKAIERLIRQLSHKCDLIIVNRLTDALEYAQKNTINVILLDLGLPDSSGLETVLAFKTIWNVAPIVVLTGREDTATMSKVMGHGAQDFLIKSQVTLEVLERSIAYAMKRHVVLIELETAKNAAEMAVKAKRDFLATVSHELRTPLNGIMGFTELLLLEAVLIPKHREYLEIIKECALQQEGVVNDIIEYSSYGSKKIVLTPREIKLDEWLDGVLAIFEREVKQRGLTLVSSIAPEVSKWIFVDSVRLQQVVANLVQNAIKFTERGGVAVSIECTDVRDGVSTLLISVSDTGIGIPADKHHEIFNPFVQLSDYMTRAQGGLGLGLAHVTELVRALGGTVSLTSAPGEGSTFRFTAKAENRSDPLNSKSQDIEPSSTQPPQSRKYNGSVLLAEDSSSSALLVKEYLTSLNLEVIHVWDGHAAIATARSRDFDLILMDLQLPLVDGYETTRQIKSFEQEQGKSTPIIAVTAHALEEEIERCKRAGISDYITKPINRNDFIKIIRRYCKL